MWAVWPNRSSDFVLKTILMMSSWANSNWPNASRWAILLEYCLVESRNETQFYSCWVRKTGRLLDFLTMMWANSESCLPILANPMQFLWHHLACIQNPSPICCSLPPTPPQQVLCVSQTEMTKLGVVHAIHGIFGLKALSKQLDQII